MLSDLVKNLRTAKTAEEKERAYRQLEMVGVDRMTASVVAAEMEDAYEIQSVDK